VNLFSSSGEERETPILLGTERDPVSETLDNAHSPQNRAIQNLLASKMSFSEVTFRPYSRRVLVILVTALSRKYLLLGDDVSIYEDITSNLLNN
jgi:hypothetical protein